MLSQKGYYRNLEYKKSFKEQIEVLEAYNRGVIFGNSLGATAQEIAMLGLDVESEGNVQKAQISERRKYLATAFLISSDRSRYSEQILSLQK